MGKVRIKNRRKYDIKCDTCNYSYNKLSYFIAKDKCMNHKNEQYNHTVFYKRSNQVEWIKFETNKEKKKRSKISIE